MLTVNCNGQTQSLENACDLATALQQWGFTQASIAVAINEKVIPHSMHTQVLLQDHDVIEIVSPFEGG